MRIQPTSQYYNYFINFENTDVLVAQSYQLIYHLWIIIKYLKNLNTFWHLKVDRLCGTFSVHHNNQVSIIKRTSAYDDNALELWIYERFQNVKVHVEEIHISHLNLFLDLSTWKCKMFLQDIQKKDVEGED